MYYYKRGEVVIYKRSMALVKNRGTDIRNGAVLYELDGHEHWVFQRELKKLHTPSRFSYRQLITEQLKPYRG